jgi:hypothetical protein
MAAMRGFYEDILGFPLLRELSPGWIEYRVGNNTLALARPSLTAADAPTPNGSASLQLAFKVPLLKLTSAPTNSRGRASRRSRRPPTGPLDIAPFSSVIRMEICLRCLRISSWTLGGVDTYLIHKMIAARVTTAR